MSDIQVVSGIPSQHGLQLEVGNDADFMKRFVSARNQTGRVGVEPVTVVNLNPYRLVVTHSAWAGLPIPARESNQRYAARVIEKVEYQRLTGLTKQDDQVAPIYPIELAEEFVLAQARNGAGGVFVLRGDLRRNPELERSPEFEEKFAEAEAYMIAFCSRLKSEADNYWNSVNHSEAKNIQETHKRAARELLSRNLLPAPPAWLDVDLKNGIAGLTLCPTCKTEPKPGALICIACNEVLDPAKAFLEHKIPETHESLERLTRAEVVALGIGAYVAETADERPKRLAAGRRKPLSQYERNAEQEMRQEAQQERAAVGNGQGGGKPKGN